MDTNKNKPKKLTEHGIIRRAVLDRVSDVFKGNFNSTIKEKIAQRLNEDEDLQSFIADNVVQQLKNITKDRSSIDSQLPVVKKILNKIYRNNEFKEWVKEQIDYAYTEKDKIIAKLKTNLRSMLNKMKPTIERKYNQLVLTTIPKLIEEFKKRFTKFIEEKLKTETSPDFMKNVEEECMKFIDEELKKEINNIKETYFSTHEAAPKINDDTIPNFGKNKQYLQSDKILNPKTGRYVKRNGKIGRQLLKGNVPKTIKNKTKNSKNSKNSKATKRIKNKKNSRNNKK